MIFFFFPPIFLIKFVEGFKVKYEGCLNEFNCEVVNYEPDPDFVRHRWLPGPACSDEFGTFDELQKKTLSTNSLVCGPPGSSSVNIHNSMYWEGNNVLVDFDRRTIGSETASYGQGFITADCSMSGSFNSNNNPFLGGATYSSGALNGITPDRVEPIPTFFATRDDCGNMWHDSADLLRMSVMQQLLQLDPSEMKAVVLDSRLMCHGQRLNQVDLLDITIIRLFE